MSKKKNTLKDLDEFLKQQAATLVTPDRLGKPQEERIPDKPEEHITPTHSATEEVSKEKILAGLKQLAKKEGPAFRIHLYDLIIQSIESEIIAPEDMMLINTVLYLKHGDNWKEGIKEYWERKIK